MYNVALIGIGNIGLNFDSDKNDLSRALSHIKAIFLHKKFDLKYVCDLNDKHFNKIKEFFSNVYTTTNYEELIKKDDIDILVIATPTNSHYEILNAFSQNENIKLFFVEKPLFSNADEYDKVDSKIKDKILVNYLRRFDNAILNLKEYLSKRDTVIKKIVINYCKGLRNNGSHMIDLVNLLLNNPKIESIKGISSSIGFSSEDLCYDFVCNVKYEKETIPIHFISHDHTIYNLIDVNIYTSISMIKYMNSKNQIEYFDIVNDENFPEYKVFSKECKVDKLDNLYSVLSAYSFIEKVLKQQSKNISSFDDEVRNKTFLEKILKEVDNGKVSN